MSFICVFPGQGSQSVGMLAGLAENAAVKSTFDIARQVLGMDLWKITQEGPEEQLNQTDITQPAMLAAGVAVYRAWIAAGGAEPALMAGHSLGEYTALVCAGALSFEDGLRAVRERGLQMQAAVPPGQGAMAAILGLDDAQVQRVCEAGAQGEIVAPANYNTPGQVVIAGAANAVDRVVELAKAAGAKRAKQLSVSVPSHCALMKPAAEKFAQTLCAISFVSPIIPVIHNVDAQSYSDVEQIREALAKQLYQPVRWTETILSLQARGIRKLVECGPGKVLVGLNKRIDSEMISFPIFDEASLAAALGGIAS